MTQTKPIKRKRAEAIMRRLDPSDPRSLGHPCHDEQWLEYAKHLARAMADAEWDRLNPENKDKEKC
jgi:hypothetical protein